MHPFIAAVVVLCLAMVALPRPDLALVALLAIVPAAAIVDPDGATVPLLAATAIGVVLFRMTLTGFRPRVHLGLILLIAFAVMWSYLMPQVAQTPDRSWGDLACLLTGLGVLAASAVVHPSPRSVACCVAGTGACAAGYLLIGGEYVADRLTGLGLNSNYLGAMLALALVAAVGLARLDRSWAWLLPALACALALLETRSRGAFLMAAAGLACVLLVGRPMRQKVVITLTVLAVAMALPGTFDAVEDNLMGKRSSTELTANTEVRMEAALLALRVALDHPIRGIGYGGFPSYAHSPSALSIYINTHNDYLRLAAEAGVVTLALFLALLWLGLCRRHAPDRVVLQSLCAAYAVGLLFANTLGNVVVTAPFWVSLGCLLAQARRPHPGGASRGRPSGSTHAFPAPQEAARRASAYGPVGAGDRPSAETGAHADK
ncbi:O-antigen ligase family protein [Streptomyces sp. PKU-EA00015]|uniref:O-antigen ligase family protein n=1 Tax=Streptomyces sp. PKU-EA00015 TaxID=2748326 RepID=UPI0015A07B55|nr:O-antigen ligase family protein [Streptomyces sp. PKU-EA00015]NWF24842.1 O-antigen ligase family protein [Streptomyces sp. PKU-EA00015]